MKRNNKISKFKNNYKNKNYVNLGKFITNQWTWKKADLINYSLSHLLLYKNKKINLLYKICTLKVWYQWQIKIQTMNKINYKAIILIKINLKLLKIKLIINSLQILYCKSEILKDLSIITVKNWMVKVRKIKKYVVYINKYIIY